MEELSTYFVIRYSLLVRRKQTKCSLLGYVVWFYQKIYTYWLWTSGTWPTIPPDFLVLCCFSAFQGWKLYLHCSPHASAHIWRYSLILWQKLCIFWEKNRLFWKAYIMWVVTPELFCLSLIDKCCYSWVVYWIKLIYQMLLYFRSLKLF